MLEGLGKSIMPEKIRRNIRDYLIKTGKKDVDYGLYGVLFLLSIIVTITGYVFVVFPNLKDNTHIHLIFGSFISLTLVEFGLIAVMILGLWLYYELIIFKRTREIEAVLPDFLGEVSINLRAGMSFDKALWESIEPEFGVLEKEIEIVAKKVMTGEDTEEALAEFAKKYNSTLLKESMDMLVVGLKSGGNIADLIEKIVKNVKDASFLKKELVASVTSYIIFITITAIIISPVLFALSFNLMQIIQNLGEKITSTSSYDIIPISLGKKSIDPKDFIIFSKISLVIISSISSMIVADLREGSIKAGLKYIVIFTPVAYFTYIIMLNLFTSIFGTLI